MPEEDRAEDRRVLQRLALEGWSPTAGAQVVSVAITGHRAEVALLVNGDYGYWTYFQRVDHIWYETVSSSGPTSGWDDPTVIEWGVEFDPPTTPLPSVSVDDAHGAHAGALECRQE